MTGLLFAAAITEFATPEYSWLFLAIPLLALSYLVYDQQRRRRFGQMSLPPPSSQPLALQVAALCLGWSFAVFALMAPYGKMDNGSLPLTPPKRGKIALFASEVVFIIDLSRSMLAQDGVGGEKRLERAREIALGVLEHLGGVNVSVVGFSSTGELLVPPTMDYLYTRLMLQKASPEDMPSPGTDFAALVDFLNKAKLSKNAASHTLFLLLSDGEDSSLFSLPPELRPKAERAIFQGFANLGQNNSWFIVGIGSDKGSPLPQDANFKQSVTTRCHASFLRQIATSTRGHYAGDSPTIDLTFADAIVSELANGPRIALRSGTSKENADERNPRRYRTTFPLLMASFLLLISLSIRKRMEQI